MARRQLRVALTGGVGAGKSTVGDLLAELGAFRIDADQIARQVVAPGSAGLAAVRDRFGDAVLTTDGALDRAALAAVVFADPDARAALNAIVHPLVSKRSAELMDGAAPDAIVVYEIPLLAETGRAAEFDAVVVVESPLALRLDRLTARGLGEPEARARIAAQATDQQRRAIADDVVPNATSRVELAASVQALWHRLQQRHNGC